ncbi:hypothetical protein NSK_004342 [Nannochloropsis salina CCMP1776]|uniref:Uncharacterized protein n=1 Tax=Nannochloropsis salina CCMP1776 TaxID=1027361 RepID=A0A4D9D0E3_9STRA|nr:hypothetical protein NSK_004342 [Nannochloropsis salina CCMP1776]|eukprot:TFJ84354.1 hypothetical protein NSK_004342 [Nannochloropsis salina CCMP1776]
MRGQVGVRMDLGKTLTTEQLQACHFLVHVRVAGGPAADAAFSTLGGGLTLDTDVALSIVLHHFTAWSRYNTHRFCGQKYVKGQARKKGQFEDEEQQRLRNERRQQRLKADILSQPETESTEVTNTVEVNQEAEEEVSIWSGFWGKGALAEK